MTKHKQIEILRSTQYVNLENQKEFWYQLAVINQFSFDKAICYEKNDGKIIYFSLRKNTVVNNVSYKSEIVEELTQDMIVTLINMGFRLC